ncbi:sensor domain-containing diguanylate cyclase [Aliikangiella coralliicola]|nr:sensor domain-containing diguanylate cyclase [Aliikangiella coralliicola]
MDESPQTRNFLPYNHLPFNELTLEDLKLTRWQKLIDTIARLFSAPSVMLTHANEKGLEVLASSSNQENPYSYGDSVPLDCNVYCHHVVQKNKSLYVKDAEQDGRWEDNPEWTKEGFRSYLGVPLNWPDGRVFGTLCVLERVTTDYSDEYYTLLENFKEIIEFELKLIDTTQKLKSLSVLDDLTGLYNRRGLLEASKHIISIANRNQLDIAVLYVDLDNLKSVNDNFGHDIGDKMIKASATTISVVLRSHDIAARVGGDEFVVVAAIERRQDMEKLIQRLNQATKDTIVSLVSKDKSIPLSISLGGKAAKIKTIRELKKLIEQADSIMMKLKKEKKIHNNRS